MIFYYANGEIFYHGTLNCKQKAGKTKYYYPDGKELCEINYGDPYQNVHYHGEIKTYAKDGAILTCGRYEEGYPVEGTFLSCRNDRPEWIPGRCHDKYILTYKDGKLVDVAEEKKSFLEDCPEEIKKLNARYSCWSKEDDKIKDIVAKMYEKEHPKEKALPRCPWDEEEASDKH